MSPSGDTPPSEEKASTSRAGSRPRKPPTATLAPRGGGRETFSSLKVRGFLFLWLGVLAMMASVQMQMMARSYLVYDITGSASLLAIVSVGSALPILTLSLIGGVIADRVERKRVIQTGQAMSALLALIIGFAITTDRIAWYHLMAASVMQGALWAFLMPARQAIIPQLVGRERLSNALALNAAAMSGTSLASPAIAGGLYALAGPDTVYYVIAGLALTAVLLTALVPKAGSGQIRSESAMLKEIAAGLGYIRHSPIVLVLLVMGLATTLLAMPIRFLMPVFVVDVYQRGPDSLGLLLAVMGGGSLAGSLFIAWLGRWRRGLLLISGSFLSGVALLLLAAVPIYFAAAGIMLLLGLGDAARRTLNQTLVMEEVEDRFRGRVMSVFMMNFGLMPLGVLPMGLVADWIGGQAAIGIMAVLLLATTAAIFATQKRLRAMQ